MQYDGQLNLGLSIGGHCALKASRDCPSSSTYTTTSTTTSSSSTTTTASSTSSTSAPQPTVSLAPGFQVTYDCAYSPPDGFFPLPDSKYVYLDDNTPLACTTLCTSLNYSIAATEYGVNCLCGNSYVDDMLPTAIATEYCDGPCLGDPTQTCGGMMTAQIYTKVT
jgi:hypothetical protein